MKKLAPEKLTFTRVGPNEPWCGWQIAGKTANVPVTATKEFTTIQGINATAATAMLEKGDVETAYEWICKNDSTSGNFIYFTKLKYCFLDDSLPSHCAGMRADTVIYSVKDNPELLKQPYKVLSIDKSCFDNQLDIDKKRDENGELIIAQLSPEDASTAFNSLEYDFNEGYDLVASVNKFFSDKSKYVEFIKCIYWAMTYEHWSTLQIVMENNVDDRLELLALIINSIVPSMRSYISFRTDHVVSPAPPVKIECCTYMPTSGKYFNLATGENNVFNELISKKYSKYPFIEYFAMNYNSQAVENYFDKIEKTMGELGDSTSIDLNFIKVAHDLSLEDKIADDITDIDLLKKFQNFLLMPYNNEKIDSQISSILELLISRKIALNENIQERLYEKLQKTTCESLINVGYSFTAGQMVKDSNRNKQFISFEGFMPNKELFGIMYRKVYECEGGKEFIDEFYGKYYGPKIVKNPEELNSFSTKIRSLSLHKYSDEFIVERITAFGYNMVKSFFAGTVSIDKEFDKYVANVKKLFPGDSVLINEIIQKVRKNFWDTFTFKSFSYKYSKDYKKIRTDSERKSILVNKIIEYFDILFTQNKSTTMVLKDYLYNKSNMTSEDIAYVVKEYQSCCVDRISKKSSIDFWHQVSFMSGPENACKFLFDNNIEAFTNPELFLLLSSKSRRLSDMSQIRLLLNQLEAYQKHCADKDSVSRLISTLKALEKECKKQEKVQRKESADTEKTNTSTEDSSYKEKSSGSRYAKEEPRHGLFSKKSKKK